MDFLLKHTSGVVSELFDLCEDIKKQTNCQPDLLKKIKRRIKQQISANGKVEKRQTQDQIAPQNVSASNLPGSINKTAVRKLSQSIPSDSKKKSESISDLDTISKDSTQENPISERLQTLILKLLKELDISDIVVSKAIRGYQGDPIAYLGLSNPVYVAIDDVLAQLAQVKADLEVYNANTLLHLFDDLSDYYIKQREHISETFKTVLGEQHIKDQDPRQIEQAVQTIINNDIIQISAPFIEQSLSTQKSLQKFCQQNAQYEVQRIALELVQPCQKNLMIYLMNKFLLNNFIKPSIVIRVKEMQKEKKIFTYYLVTPNTSTEALVNLDEYFFDKDTNVFAKDGDPHSVIKLDQFISHVLSSILTVPLEGFHPNYAIDHEGNMYRVFNHIQSKDGKANHSALRNPLFFFKDVMTLQLQESFFQRLFKQEYFLQFCKCLTLIIEGQKNDYRLNDKNKQSSLYLSFDQYQYIFSSLQRINQAFMWVKEVILPTKGFFQIADLINKVYPIILEFISSNKSKSLKEYTEFMKKISIEEFIQKIATKRSLLKYRDACNSFDEGSKVSQTQKNDSLDIVLRQWLSGINLANISSPKYKLTLIYFASCNYLFHNTPLTDQNFTESTWKSEESWENALTIFYSEEHFDNVSFNPSIFVELLALYFGINIKKYQNCFDSIKYFDETEESFELLGKYFAHKKILGDKYFPERETLFEKSLKYKKFKLAKYLLSIGEGKKLRPETLIQYFIKHSLNKQYSSDISDILNEIIPYHKQLVLEYQWNHIWNDIFLSVEVDLTKSIITTPSQETEAKYLHVYSTNFGERKIPQYIWEQAFQYNNQTNEFIFNRKGVEQQISHLTGYYCLLKMGNETSGTILIEHANRYPGLNYMKDSLMKKFIPNSRLRKELVKIQNEYFYFSHFNSQMDSFSFQLSGKGPYSIQENIDREFLSDRLILEMILYPESNPSSCFLTESQPNAKQALIDIGQSEMLVQNIGLIDGEHQMYVKSVLFCLYEMNTLIPNNIVAKYAKISSYEIIKEWLLELSKFQDELLMISEYKFKQNNFTPFIQETIEFNSQFEFSERENQPYFGIPIQKEAIKHLIERVVTISKVMKWCQKKNTSITHQELFSIVDKELASMYENVNSDQQTFLEKKYSQVLEKFVHQQTFNLSNMASMRMSFSEKRRGDITSINQLLSNFKQIGPTQALEKIKKFIKIITIDETDQELLKIQNVRNIKQFNFFQRNIQFKYLNTKQLEEQVLKILQEQKLEKPFDYLNLSNSSLLTIKVLKQFQLERIQTLILSNTKIADQDLNSIAESYKSLVYLDISNCDDINYIGSTKPLNYLMSSQINFPSLKTLVANNMKNLWILDLAGSHIQNLSINFSPKLTYFFINCPQIKKISVLGCKSLMNDLIAMYVLEGTSVHVDSVTSDGKFEKGIKVIRGSKGNFLQAYQSAINEIFGQLHFSDTVSIKENLVVISQAFTKRNLQHIFPKNFVSSMIGNIFSSKKANKQINDEFFRFMFKFYVKNPHIKELDFKAITQENNPITFFNIVDDALVNIKLVASQYESYIFRNLELYPEDLVAMSKIIQKTEKEGLSVFFINCRIQNEEKISEFYSAFSQNRKTYNKISFEDCDLVKIQIEKMRDMFLNFQGRLQQLRISKCNLDNSHLPILCEGLKKLNFLKVLDLSGNFLTTKSFKLLTPCFESFSHSFQTLILDDNNLSSDDFEDIQGWKFIKILQIKSCFIGSNQLNSLQSYLCSNQECKLTQLNLSQNKLSPHCFNILSEILKRNNTLKELGLNSTIQDGTQEACLLPLAEGLKSNSNLTLLDISKNSINNEGLKIIEECIKENVSLKFIKILEDNSFDLEVLKQLAETLKQHPSSLKSLDLSPRPNIIEFDDIYSQLIHILEYNNNRTTSNIRLKKHTSQIKKYFQNHTLLDYKSEGSDFCRLGLSIDGGGMRGIIPATMLKVLCEETKYKVHEIFETVGGTSIGGLLALGTTGTLDGVNPIIDENQMVNIFLNDGGNIFNTSKLKAILNNLMDSAKYDPAGLESVLFKNFQNCKLSDVLKGTNVIITAVRREMQQGKSIAKVFRSREAIFNDDKNFYMRDVARATSAAPTFFPSAEIKNINQTKSFSLVDGGVGQNNPSKLVLEDIKKEALNSGSENNFFLLSLGTGETKKSQQLSKNAGLLNVVNIIDSFGEGASAYVDIELKQNYDDKYLRIQPQIPIKKEDAELDSLDPKIIEIYQQSARHEAYEHLCKESKYGPFNDRPIVEWFAENTARKKDVYI